MLNEKNDSKINHDDGGFLSVEHLRDIIKRGIVCSNKVTQSITSIVQNGVMYVYLSINKIIAGIKF